MKKLVGLLAAVVLLSSNATQAYAGSFTFYLNMTPGCYSYNSPASDTYPIEGSKYKTVFRTICEKPHHIQVIYSGVPKSKARTITELEVFKWCQRQYKSRLGIAAPTSIQADYPYLRYYWPDAGLERLKYNNKVICYIHSADNTYDNYLQMVEGY